MIYSILFDDFRLCNRFYKNLVLYNSDKCILFFILVIFIIVKLWISLIVFCWVSSVVYINMKYYLEISKEIIVIVRKFFMRLCENWK